MARSIDLLEKTRHPAYGWSDAEWCRQLAVNRTALSVARMRGKLSASLAANLARLLGEPVAYWTALAALENEKPSYARNKMLSMLQDARNS